jgi:hypothetical protein
MSGPDARGKGISREGTVRRLLLLAMLSMMLTAMAASVVEAAAMDSVRNTWSSMRVYVLSGPFWVNALIVFAVLFMLSSLLFQSKMGYDNTHKVMMYIVIGIIALVIATKFVASNGAPQYIWQNEQLRSFTQFLIGPDAAHQKGACAAPGHSLLMSLLPFGWGEPNPPCCGAGAYEITVSNMPLPACKQAILRTNENGSGLPAFIIAGILFFLLFKAYSKNLGFDSAGGGGGKWFPIVISVVLAALVANERVTKNHILIIGGWVALVLLGNKLSKTLGGGGKDENGSKRGFGFGLAYAFIQLVLNMLGTSLWGGEVAANEIGSSSIIWNILIGAVIGAVYSFFASGGKGIFSQWKKSLGAAGQKRLDAWNKAGRPLMGFLSSIPGIGSLFKPPDSKTKALIKKLEKSLRKLWEDYVDEISKPSPDATKLTVLHNRLRDTAQTIEALKSAPMD